MTQTLLRKVDVNFPLALYRTEQIKTLEQFVIQRGIISGFTLMRCAGEAVFSCIRERYPKTSSIVIFCGSGNNAGDGYVVATLALQAGISIRVYSVTDMALLQGDALTVYQQYIEAGGAVALFQAEVKIDAELIIDALLGTGLSRDVTGSYAQAIEVINQSLAPVIAIDIPSGLNADTGNVMGCAVEADITVTFIGLKQGLFTGFAAQHVGDVFYTSLDLPPDAWECVKASVQRILPKSLPRRPRYAHKGNFGHVLVVGGDVGYSGAARLASIAALRVGAGLVSIATHPENAAMMNATCPELMCHGIDTLDKLKSLLDKASVVVVGTGLGQSEWAKTLFDAVLKVEKPLIVDADGLNFLARSPCKRSRWILTPHVGEAARLLAVTTKDIQMNRFEAVKTLQQRYNGVVLLKGAGTLIASEHLIAVSNTGNAGMASGGMGDVLAGVIAGLVAQGVPLDDAAQQGAYGHGLAADEAIKKEGERGLLASDLLPHLRKWANGYFSISVI